MKDIGDMLMGMDAEVYTERLIGPVDVERLDGTTLRNVALVRHEKYADPKDIESVYEREYVVEHKDEEIFVGNDCGQNITIKERRETC